MIYFFGMASAPVLVLLVVLAATIRRYTPCKKTVFFVFIYTVAGPLVGLIAARGVLLAMWTPPDVREAGPLLYALAIFCIPVLVALVGAIIHASARED